MLLLRTFNWLLRLIRMHKSQLDRFLLDILKRIKGNRIIFDVKPTQGAFLTSFSPSLRFSENRRSRGGERSMTEVNYHLADVSGKASARGSSVARRPPQSDRTPLKLPASDKKETSRKKKD